MTEQPFRYGKSLSIDALSDAIGGDEAHYGTLKALASGESNNYAIFELGKSPVPSVELIIGTQAPNNYVKICNAKLFILSQLLDVVAIRRSGN